MSWIDDIFSGLGDASGSVDNFDPSLMGDPSSYGLGGLDLGSGELNAGFGGGGTPISDPGINWDTNQGSNWDGNADPWGGLSLSQLNGLAGAAGGMAGAGGAKPTAGPLHNADGSINWGSLLPLLLAGGSGIMNRQATQHATDQTVAGINHASDQATSLINGASAGYQPYMQAGQGALAKLSALQPSNLAGQFGSLGNGRGIK